MSYMTDATDHTFITRFRIPKVMWEAYGRVTERLGTDRTADLVAHVREVVTTHGDERDLADLAAGETELTERRSRKGGRPPRRTSAGEQPDPGSSEETNT